MAPWSAVGRDTNGYVGGNWPMGLFQSNIIDGKNLGAFSVKVLAADVLLLSHGDGLRGMVPKPKYSMGTGTLRNS